MTETSLPPYSLGNGGYNFSSQQVATLQADINAVLAAITTHGAGGQIYSDLLGMLSDGDGNPLPGVDSEVYAWISAATGINAGSSAAGLLIKNYTNAIYQTRSGNPLAATSFYTASNKIAINVALSILANGNQSL